MYNKLEQYNTMMIGLVGKARSGKSSVANILRREYGYEVYPMADAIRKGLLAAIPFLSAEYLHEKKQTPIPELKNATGRELLQQFGHEFGRAMDPDIWIKVLDHNLDLMKVDRRKVVIDDVRYDNECQWVKYNNGCIIGVDRPGMQTESWMSHGSEHSLSSSLVDEWIANISCYETDLECAVRDTMTRILEPELESV